MELILFKVNESSNSINKTLENGLSIDVNFKADTDLKTPTIKLANIDDLENGRFNYFYLPDLDKYYFINQVQIVNNNMVSLNCEIDLLMTYKNIVLNSHARLKRNIKTGDYLKFNNEEEIYTTIETIEGNVSLTGNESSPILTTIGL